MWPQKLEEVGEDLPCPPRAEEIGMNILQDPDINQGKMSQEFSPLIKLKKPKQGSWCTWIESEALEGYGGGVVSPDSWGGMSHLLEKNEWCPNLHQRPINIKRKDKCWWVGLPKAENRSLSTSILEARLERLGQNTYVTTAAWEARVLVTCETT